MEEQVGSQAKAEPSDVRMREDKLAEQIVAGVPTALQRARFLEITLWEIASRQTVAENEVFASAMYDQCDALVSPFRYTREIKGLLRCGICGYRDFVDAAMLSEFGQRGFPMHCGHTMIYRRVVNDDQEQQP